MELALILNALAARFFGIRGDDRAHTISQIAAGFLTKLTAWYSSLPLCLTPAEIVFPFQLKLQ